MSQEEAMPTVEEPPPDTARAHQASDTERPPATLEATIFANIVRDVVNQANAELLAAIAKIGATLGSRADDQDRRIAELERRVADLERSRP